MSVAIDKETYDELKRQLAQAELDGEAMATEIAELREEVELWKDRWAAADQALTATIRDYENEIGR